MFRGEEAAGEEGTGVELAVLSRMLGENRSQPNVRGVRCRDGSGWTRMGAEEKRDLSSTKALASGVQEKGLLEEVRG